MSSWFNNLKAQIQEVVIVPTQNVNELMNALTLRSPELAAEQERINQEERRKEAVKDALASLLPWDTRNEEHEILVSECKDEIMGLSLKLDTFKGPFGKDNLEAEAKAIEELEDFPNLLRKFDLDAHVGLIQRLFTTDPNLVEMHSQNSGAGDAEYYFWKNYFYHCAVVRFKIGLSNSEIWDVSTVFSCTNSQVSATTSIPSTSSAPDLSNVPVNTNVGNEEDDVSITFDSDSIGSTSLPSVHSDKLSMSGSATGVDVNTSRGDSSPTGPEKDYEIVLPPGGDDGTGGDDELDDLEAEILRELES